MKADIYPCETKDGLKFSLEGADIELLQKLVSGTRGKNEAIAMFSHLNEANELLISFGVYDNFNVSNSDFAEIGNSTLYFSLSERARAALHGRTLRLVGSHLIIT